MEQGIWNGRKVSGEEYWKLRLEQLLREGVTGESLEVLLLDLDMDVGSSLYVDPCDPSDEDDKVEPLLVILAEDMVDDQMSAEEAFRLERYRTVDEKWNKLERASKGTEFAQTVSMIGEYLEGDTEGYFKTFKNSLGDIIYREDIEALLLYEVLEDQLDYLAAILDVK